jgi:hypothetical protein
MDDRHEGVTYAEDIVPRGLVLRVVVVTVVISIVLCIVAYLILRMREWQLRPDGVPSAEVYGPPHVVADVRQELFDQPLPKPNIAEEQRRRLAGYGWVDRSRGTVSIPVDSAIELLLSRQGAGQPGGNKP